MHGLEDDIIGNSSMTKPLTDSQKHLYAESLRIFKLSHRKGCHHADAIWGFKPATLRSQAHFFALAIILYYCTPLSERW